MQIPPLLSNTLAWSHGRAAAPWAPGLVAYQLLSELYAWFGFDEGAIPYVAEEGGTRVISKDEILKDG
jgi:hypothetical protein